MRSAPADCAGRSLFVNVRPLGTQKASGGVYANKVGALASVQIDLYKVDNALLVPIDAVLIQRGIPKLFVLRGDTAISTEVELGRNDQNNFEITSGINAGEKIVTLGKSFLNDGSLVTIQSKEGAGQ